MTWTAIRGATWVATALLLASAACGDGTVPRPPSAPVLAADYVEVSTSPRAPPVEIVPPPPAGATNAVWVDGSWLWTGQRFRWSPGAWVVPPEGARRARWAIVRRPGDGQLFFAPAVWRDEAGRVLPEPKPLALARSRLGEPTDEELARERAGADARERAPRTERDREAPRRVQDGGAPDAAPGTGPR